MPNNRCQRLRCFCCREQGLSYSDDVEYQREYEVPRNFISAAFGVITFVFLCTSLADEHWFIFHNGSCNVDALGLVPFFFDGKFIFYSVEKSNKISTKYTFSSDHRNVLINCVDSNVVLVLRTMMVLLFLSSLSTSLQVFFDLLGTRRTFFKALQIYAVGSVATVLLCFTNLWLSYGATIMLTKLQQRCLGKPDGNLNEVAAPAVSFSIGFYLNVGAAASALLAVCSTCFSFGETIHGAGGWCCCFGGRHVRIGRRRNSQGIPHLTPTCGWRCRRSPPRDINDLQSLLMDDDVPLLIPVEAPPAYTP